LRALGDEAGLADRSRAANVDEGDGLSLDQGRVLRATLEHVAQKWEPVLRAQHAIKQKLRAPDLIQSECTTL
jgi:hypothetical protein